VKGRLNFILGASAVWFFSATSIVLISSIPSETHKIYFAFLYISLRNSLSLSLSKFLMENNSGLIFGLSDVKGRTIFPLKGWERKILIKKIYRTKARQVTFSRRRRGLSSNLSDAEIALCLFFNWKAPWAQGFPLSLCHASIFVLTETPFLLIAKYAILCTFRSFYSCILSWFHHFLWKRDGRASCPKYRSIKQQQDWTNKRIEKYLL